MITSGELALAVMSIIVLVPLITVLLMGLVVGTFSGDGPPVEREQNRDDLR